MIEFIVAGRTGVDITQGIARVQAMGAKLHFADFVGPDISSTAIKQRIRQGLRIDAMVPPGVLEMIKKYGVENFLYAIKKYIKGLDI